MQQKYNRKGPRPLWLHLNAGAAMMASVTKHKPDFSAASDILQSAMEGIKDYHNSPIAPYHRDMIVVNEVFGTQLITSKTWQKRENKPVLLVPSLINDWRIFDVEQEYSFADHLASNGFCPYIVDWAVCDDDIDVYLKNHLISLVADYEFHASIGYCMGGVFLPVLHTLAGDKAKKFGRYVFIATPWDFDTMDPAQRMRFQMTGQQALLMNRDMIDIDWIQSMFWALDPLMVLRKFQNFKTLDPQSDKARRFVRVEDWLNDGRPLSRAVAKTCLYDWYDQNKPVKGEWIVAGQQVNPSTIKNLCCIITAKKDKLVPSQSSKALAKQIKNASLIEIDTGHIGLMVSNKAMTDMWNPLIQFLNQK